MNQLVALGVEVPQIDAVGAYTKGAANALALGAKTKEAAQQAMGMIGSIALGAMGGDRNGQADPQKFEQGLDILQGYGVDTAPFRGKPHLAPIVANAALSTMQQIQLANSDREIEMKVQEFERGIMESDRNYEMQSRGMSLNEQKFQADEQMADEQMPGKSAAPSGYRTSQTGDLEPIPGGPADPNNPINKRKLSPPRTATETKAIFEAQDEMPIIENTIASLERALELNDRTVDGFGANEAGRIGSKLPEKMRPESVEATREYLDIMTGEAVKQMSVILKGATTNEEMRTFVNIISDASTPKPIRKRALERMIKMVKERKRVALERISELQGDTQPSASTPSNDEVTSDEQYDALPSGAVFSYGGKRFRKP